MTEMMWAIHSRNFQVHDARGKSLRFCPSGINENTDIRRKTRINIDITKRFPSDLRGMPKRTSLSVKPIEITVMNF